MLGRDGRLGWAVAMVLLLISGCAPVEQRLAGTRRELVLEILTEAALRAAPGRGVLVVGNPFVVNGEGASSSRQADEAGVRGAERAVRAAGGRWVGVARPELSAQARRDPAGVAIPPGASTPLSFMTETGAWDRLLTAHPEAGIWISLIGVPADLGETRAWRESEGPAWALLFPDLRLIGTRAEVRAAFEGGRLAAMVLERPGAPPESEAIQGTPREEFDRRYVLVTRETLDAVVKAWPELVP